jgi:hypothetical protein
MMRMAIDYNNLYDNISNSLKDVQVSGLKKTTLGHHSKIASVSIIFSHDIEKTYWMLISQRIPQEIERKIIDEVYLEFEKCNYSVIDLTDTDTTYPKQLVEWSRCLYYEIHNKDILITSLSILTHMQNIEHFSGYVTTTNVKSEVLHKIGKLHNCEVLCDSRLSWNDNFAYCADSISYDVKLINLSLDDDNKLECKFSFDISIVNPIFFYIFTKEINSNKDILLRYKRDLKIKKILRDD